jgi:predicted Fe-Mo cluster-binding NifX family protein
MMFRFPPKNPSLNGAAFINGFQISVSMTDKVMVASSNGMVTGPGEGEYLIIYESSGDGLMEVGRELNPGLNATMHRGLYALKRAKEIGASSIVVTEIGPPGYRAAQQWGLTVYVVPEGTSVNDALAMLASGKLRPATGPTHEHGHHGH